MLLKNFCLILAICILFCKCGSNSIRTNSSKVQEDGETMSGIKSDIIDSLSFQRLISLTDSSNRDITLSDSLAFLIIPLDAVCPHCRDRAIKALIENRNRIPKEHYIIISAASHKGIKAFFAERNQENPEMKGKVFLDGESEAFKSNLIFMHPTVYYTHNKQIVKKIISYPTNIDKVLEDFFQTKGG